MRCTNGMGSIGDENCSGTRNSSGQKDQSLAVPSNKNNHSLIQLITDSAGWGFIFSITGLPELCMVGCKIWQFTSDCIISKEMHNGT